MLQFLNVLGVKINPISWSTFANFIDAKIERGDGRYVCFCTTHNVIETTRDPSYFQCMEDADLRLIDGIPLLWIARIFGNTDAERLCGPDMLPRVCEYSVPKGYRHFFYGGKEGVPERLAQTLTERFPGLKVVGTYSPPFRTLSHQEDDEVCRLISDARPDIIWVGLGTPKQDHWMFTHRERLPGVMLGVGAAFDFHTGDIKRAPMWMRKSGLEWFFRLLSEPKRLWRRYLYGNTMFILKVSKSIVLREIRRGELRESS